MKVLLVAALVALIHGSYATLLIKGPTHFVTPRTPAILECQYSDSEHNISQVFFEYLDPTGWHLYDETWYDQRIAFCGPWRFFVKRTEEQVALQLNYMINVRFPHRCVSHAENVTDADRYSQPLSLKVYDFRYMELQRDGYSMSLNGKELKVRQGEDVVVNCSATSSEEPRFSWSRDGDDWILPSPTLTLRKIKETDGGKYTCIADHPTEDDLTNKLSFTITVLPEDAPWYETSYGRLVLMTSAAGASLLVFVLSMSIFLCRRAKQAKTSKGPIDDRSQKKPIYKTSVESLPSTCADKQPLV
ncbi:uncharacterized protein si:ch211-79k12.1 [Centropristis striata]|uniref:uncharacterized protein si:ch211-79k12.1 n=1 Tax=Centropristis striata TaxID=184440 RepID=UPI0027DFE4D5|nr:uncharacterized protein si:ch211-79k12.1 [Centropristis striata]